jgi:hypothetical protein
MLESVEMVRHCRQGCGLPAPLRAWGQGGVGQRRARTGACQHWDAPNWTGACEAQQGSEGADCLQRVAGAVTHVTGWGSLSRVTGVDADVLCTGAGPSGAHVLPCYCRHRTAAVPAALST